VQPTPPTHQNTTLFQASVVFALFLYSSTCVSCMYQDVGCPPQNTLVCSISLIPTLFSSSLCLVPASAPSRKPAPPPLSPQTRYYLEHEVVHRSLVRCLGAQLPAELQPLQVALKAELLGQVCSLLGLGVSLLGSLHFRVDGLRRKAKSKERNGGVMVS